MIDRERLRRSLEEIKVPDQGGAEERALRLVRAAISPSRKATQWPGRRGLQVAVALGLIAALVSPAGAAVRHWVRDTVGPGRIPSLPALTSLPAPGQLLVDSAQGPWVVRGDGSKRLLGSYAQSAWSPHGLYLAAANGHQLAAVDPVGTVRWTLSRPGGVRDPSWSDDGERIAYLEGRDLRVVAGDGTGDRLLATGVSPVAPAWGPGSGRRVAFVEQGTIRVLDVDTGRLLWSAAAAPGTRALEWAASGSRMLALAPGEVDLFAGDGILRRRIDSPQGASFGSAALGRGGAVAAIAEMNSGARSALLLFGEGGSRERLISSPGSLDEVVYSPEGHWLLVTWRSADQWLFLNPDRPRRVVAIADIASQFNPGTTSPGSFPSIAGWCCAASFGERP